MSILLTSLPAAFAAGAGAVSPEDLPARSQGFCESFGKPLVKPDGKILLPAFGCGTSRERGMLIQLEPGGRIDSAFSNGGVRIFDYDESPRSVIPSGQHDAVLVTGRKLFGIRPDGSPLRDFGVDGELDLTSEFSAGEMTAASQADGKIVVAGRDGTGIKLMRFGPGGHLDQQFGLEGAVSLTVPGGTDGRRDPVVLGFDDRGGILGFAGVRNPDGSFGAFRLLPGGEPDPTFGPDGDGFARGRTNSGFLGVTGFAPEMPVYADGSFRVLGTYSNRPDRFGSFGVEFSADGLRVTGPFDLGTVGGVFATGRGEELYTATLPGPGLDLGFNLGRRDRAGSTSWRSDWISYDLSPGEGTVQGIAYSQTDDSIIAAGTLYGYECEPRCREQRFLAVAKIDAATGNLVREFGAGGATLISRNRCANGKRDWPGMSRPWARCVLDAPKLEARVRLRNAGERKPVLNGFATLSGAQDVPGAQTRTLAVKLPTRLKLRPRRAAKLVTGRVEGAKPSETSVRLRHRTIFIRYKPFWKDEKGSGDRPLELNRPVRVRFGLRKGAIKPLPRRLLRERLSFRLTGTFSDSRYLSGTEWFAPGKRTKTLRARAR